MKLKIGIIFFFFLFVSISLSGQVDSISVFDPVEVENPEDPRKIEQDKKKIKNTFYIKGGYALPMGKLAEQPTLITTPGIQSPFTGLEGLGVTQAWSVDIGCVFYAKKINSDNFGFGIDVSFIDITYLTFKWNNVESYPNVGYVSYGPLFFAGMKIGPVLNIRANRRFGLDFYYNIAPTLGFFPSSPVELDISPIGIDTVYSDNLGFGLRHAFGVNLKIRPLLIGVEYNMGNVEIKDMQSDAGFFNGNISGDMLRLVFGFGF